MKGTVICDGRGNAGTGARAAVLRIEGRSSPISTAERIDPSTNIVAEHLSIQLGIELALKNGVTELLILNDSQTPVFQVQGKYQTKLEHLKPLVQKTWELASSLDQVEIKWVPREKTMEADLLCRAVDEVPSNARRTRPGGPLPPPPPRQNPFRTRPKATRGHKRRRGMMK